MEGEKYSRDIKWEAATKYLVSLNLGVKTYVVLCSFWNLDLWIIFSGSELIVGFFKPEFISSLK